MTRVEMAELGVAAETEIFAKHGNRLPNTENRREIWHDPRRRASTLARRQKAPGGLSDREWAIAGLIADGDSNRMMADCALAGLVQAFQ